MDNVTINIEVSAGNGCWKEDEKVESSAKGTHTIDISLLGDPEIKELVRNSIVSEFSMKLDLVLNETINRMNRKIDEKIGQPKAGE